MAWGREEGVEGAGEGGGTLAEANWGCRAELVDSVKTILTLILQTKSWPASKTVANQLGCHIYQWDGWPPKVSRTRRMGDARQGEGRGGGARAGQAAT